MKKMLLFLIAFIFSMVNIAPAQIPDITGTVELSVKDGTVNCYFMVSNIPTLNKYSIWLNSGFNIQYFRDSANKSNIDFQKKYDDNLSYESFLYNFPLTDSTSFLPSAFRVRYTGSFPVRDDTSTMYSRMDWKGNIAFNGKTIRAADQSAWYPQLYDADNDVLIDKCTYNINITCKDCSAIYLNGDKPKTGGNNTFTSKEPASLLLYAGKFSVHNTDSTNFLNSPLSNNQEQLLAQWTNGITRFYEEKLHIPYGKKISYIATTAVSKDNSWLFVTYPSVVVVGNKQWDIKKLFSTGAPAAVDTGNIQTISHELGHYYFGTLFTPNATLRWVFLEGMTEYISLQYTRYAFGEKVYRQALQNYVSTVKSFGSIVPVSKIKRAAQVGEGYRYYYVPLLLTTLEKEIGITQAWRWLSAIVQDTNAITNYAYFKSSLLRAGMTDAAFTAFEFRYINDANAIDNVITAALK